MGEFANTPDGIYLSPPTEAQRAVRAEQLPQAFAGAGQAAGSLVSGPTAAPVLDPQPQPQPEPEPELEPEMLAPVSPLQEVLVPTVSTPIVPDGEPASTPITTEFPRDTPDRPRLQATRT